MPNQEAASASRRIPCPGAVDPNERGVGLLALPVFQEEILAPRVRSLNGDVKRGVRQRRGIKGVGALRYGERCDRNPAELTERPRVHARRTQRGREAARAHKTPLPNAL